MNTSNSLDTPHDLEPKGTIESISPSSKGSASLEVDLERANKRIAKYNAERIAFVIVLLIIWDAHTFKSYSGWAPVIALLVLELVGLYIIAWRFDMHEVIQLFWGAMKSYSKRDVGDTPDDTASS